MSATGSDLWQYLVAGETDVFGEQGNSGEPFAGGKDSGGDLRTPVRGAQGRARARERSRARASRLRTPAPPSPRRPRPPRRQYVRRWTPRSRAARTTTPGTRPNPRRTRLRGAASTAPRPHPRLRRSRELLQGRPGAGIVQALEVGGMPAQRVQRERPGADEDLLRVPHYERNADSPAPVSLFTRDLYRQGDGPPQRQVQATDEWPPLHRGRSRRRPIGA